MFGVTLRWTWAISDHIVTSMFIIGDKVIHTRLSREEGRPWIGIVEAIDPEVAPSGRQCIDVRWLLDDGVTKGCCTSMCWDTELEMIL